MVIYEHYLRRSYDFASELHLRKSLRSSYDVFCRLDVRRKSIVILALL